MKIKRVPVAVIWFWKYWIELIDLLQTMSSRRINRIQNDLRLVKEDSERFKTVSLVSDDISHWEIVFNNNQLPDFLGSLKIYAKFPLEYPSKPPSIRIPQIYHPNVYATGALCLSILDEISLPGAEGASWRPTISMWSVLLGVQNVLIDPNPDSPANVPAKNMFVKYITSSILRKILIFPICSGTRRSMLQKILNWCLHDVRVTADKLYCIFCIYSTYLMILILFRKRKSRT